MRELTTIEYIIITIILATLAAILVVTGGCTTIGYNPETKDFHYQAPPWGKKIGKVSVIRETDGSILFEMSDYQTENLSAIVEGAVSGAVKGLK